MYSMPNMIHMNKEDYNASLNLAEQKGREDALKRIREMFNLWPIDDENHLLVMRVKDFNRIENEVRGMR